MKAFEEIRVLLREKDGKKLAAVTVIIFLLITAIVFFATFKLFENTHLKLMNDYLGAIPRMLDSGRNELLMRSRIYEDDILTRAELGLKIYSENSALTDAEKLERTRSAASAASVSLLDGQRQTAATTGAVSPGEIFSACTQGLEPRKPHLEFYPALQDGKETDKNDGKGFVLLPVPGNADHSLVFEFACGTVLEMYDALEDWSNTLRRVLSTGDITAYAKTGDILTGYPTDVLTSGLRPQLDADLTKVFENAGSFRRTENGGLTKIVPLLGRRHLAALMHYPQEDTDILLTIPLRSAMGNGVYIAAAISAIIGVGLLLIQLYVFRRLRLEKAGNGSGKVTLGWVCRTTWPGILTALAVTLVFSTMLLLLETRSNAAFFAATSRESLQNEIDWRRDQEETIRATFADVYRSRTQTLTAFLTEHPDYQTRAGLQELSRIAGSEYLMRFDRDGQELVSSNSYTGFAVGKNLSEDYRAVLLGYPCAVVGPEADPYTDEAQIGAAILMTDGDGQPDGFLLAVYSAGDLAAELKRMKPEYTVNHFAVQKGHVAAAISDADGSFIAHTDSRMIGQKAEDWLEGVKPGSGFEGFTGYSGRQVYVSASAADGRTLLFIVPEFGDSYVRMVSALMVLAVLLILVLLYYPAAGMLSERAMEHAQGSIPAPARQESPMLVFYDGYVVFLTLFAAFALFSSSKGWWTSFDYVFSAQWSKGLNLFSLWGALFVLVVTLFCLYVIRTVLNHLENRLSLRAKTITRLANSLITYAAIIFLAFCILDMFGVNTTALVASAGIISIAVGMGAQSMASDLLAGFFMMLEGSVHVGDQVSIATNVKGNFIDGRVTDIGIRTTEITDKDGNVTILSNSKVTGLCNKSRNHPQQEPESGTKDAGAK